MEDFVKRMITERDELKERIDKLKDFIDHVENGNAKVSDYEFDWFNFSIRIYGKILYNS